MIKSKFRLSIIGPIFLAVCSSAVLMTVGWLFIKEIKFDMMMWTAILVFLPVWLWIVRGELRKKVLQIHVWNEGIEVASFLGFGKKKTYLFAYFDGFYTISMQSQYNNYEYLFLVKDDSRIVRVSEFYYKNYAELKTKIRKHTKYFGDREFRWSREIRDVL